MLRLEKLSLSRGGRELFTDLDWSLDPGERVGLVGANGAGKSSLMRVIAGEIAPESGRVLQGRDERVGYLPQEGLTHAGRTLLEEAAAGMTTLGRFERAMQEALEELDRIPADDPRHAQAVARHAQAESAFRAHGGYARDAQVARVLHGLGFSAADLARDCAELSGGWQMRIALGKLLLESPDVLLLDEPTNHLDIEARTWLEHFLTGYPGAVVVVSHDRTFLDRVTTRICELRAAELTCYSGSFTQYLAARALRVEQLQKAYAEQQDEIQRMELFIRRFRAKATKAAQVQSRVKALEKMERIELPASEQRIRFRFPPAPRSGPTPLALRGASKSYGSLRVLSEVDAAVHRGDRICLAGPNGAGKSTLLRLLAGREALDAGVLERDRHGRIAYFAQDQAQELPPEETVLDVAAAAAPGAPPAQVRALLGAFLFRGDDVHKRCRVLSGGERSRLALARILLGEANVLLLDEPTNHLDLNGKETLLEALLGFDGGVVFVSHDRDFSSALATTVIEVGGGRADRFEMGFEDFLWKRAFDLGYQGSKVDGVAAPDLWFLRGTEYFERDAATPPAPASTDLAPTKLRYEERKQLQRRADALRKRAAELERESEAAAAERALVGQQMAAPELARDHVALAQLQAKWEDLGEAADRSAARWHEAMEELEALEAKLDAAG